jgi:hypothetical protein
MVSFLALRMFYASLIRDTFRVRLDAGGQNIKDLLQAKSRRKGQNNIAVKPWMITPPVPTPKELKELANDRIKMEVSSSSSH